MMSEVVRSGVTRWIVNARLLGGLGVIVSCWVVTGVYMAFSEGLLWAKGRMRRKA